MGELGHTLLYKQEGLRNKGLGVPGVDRIAVLSCLCDNACKGSLAICCKIRALCLVSRILSVPIWPACAEQGR